MVALGRWFTRRALLALKFLSGYVHRGTLPQSRPCGRASSLREGAGMRAVPFIGVLAIIQRFGRFSSPLRNSKVFYIPPLIGVHSLREGAGMWAVPFIGVLAKIRRWRAIFIAPTKLKSFLHSTTHRGTLPQSRPLGVTAPSGREPGCGLYHSSNRQETGALRAIFIAPTNGVFNSIRRPETGALNM